MRPWLLHVLRCPRCGEGPLALEIGEAARLDAAEPPFFRERPCHRHGRTACEDCAGTAVRAGALRCPVCGPYPIEGFVPDFAGAAASELTGDASETYAYLWESFDIPRVAGEDDAQALETFRTKSGKREEELRGRLVLDAGCGPGQLVSLLGGAGAHAVGCDLVVAPNLRSLERARAFDFVQCDLLAPPFAQGTFDLVYSIGVIHHIPEAEDVMRRLGAITRPGGAFHVWLYSAEGSRLLLLDDALRAVTTRLPHSWVKGLSVALSPLFPLAHRLKGGKGRRIRRKDTEHLIYDWLRTPYRRFFRSEEVEALFPADGWRVAYRSPIPLGLTFEALPAATEQPRAAAHAGPAA